MVFSKQYVEAYLNSIQKLGLLRLMQLEKEKLEELCLIHNEILKR